MITKNKVISFTLLGILTLLVFAGAASAAVLTFIDISSPISTNPGGDVLITFKLNHTGESTTNQTGLNWSTSTINKGVFKQLPTLEQINVGENRPLSAIITIPRNASGALTFTIKVQSSSFATAEFTRTITINDVPSLAITKTREITTSQNGTIELENNGNTVLGNIVLSSSGELNLAFSENNFDLSPGSKKTVTVSSSNLANIGINGRAGTVTATATTGGPATGSVSFNVPGSFCTSGPKGGNLSINDVEIDNRGEGEDDEWKLIDNIEIKVEVENIGNDDVDNVKVVLGLFDSTGRNKIGDLDFEGSDEEEIDLGRLRDGDSETATFTFKVPADMDDGDYKLVVKTYSSKTGQNKECAESDVESISIVREDDERKFIAFDDIVLSPSEATCGDTITLTADVFNVGDEDQDQVKVNLFNRLMNLNQNVEIRSDLDMGDKESVSFEFVVPEGLADKTYQLELTSEYDYRSGTYRESSSESEIVPLKISGCGAVTPGRVASIRAVLDSAAKSGEELDVKATITNLKNTETTFIVDAKDYQNWATLGSISPRTLTLAAGESKEVTFKLDVNEDTSGEESFTIDVLSGTEVVESKEVVVNIAAKETGATNPFAGLGSNTYLWIIGAINVILVILIIVVAIRISRR